MSKFNVSNYHLFFQPSRSNGVSSQQDKTADEPKDYIHFYESDSEKFPPPPPPEHLYDFQQESISSNNSGIEKNQKTVIKSLASMGDLVVEQVEKLSTQEVSTNIKKCFFSFIDLKKLIFIILYVIIGFTFLKTF